MMATPNPSALHCNTFEAIPEFSNEHLSSSKMVSVTSASHSTEHNALANFVFWSIHLCFGGYRVGLYTLRISVTASIGLHILVCTAHVKNVGNTYPCFAILLSLPSLILPICTLNLISEAASQCPCGVIEHHTQSFISCLIKMGRASVKLFPRVGALGPTGHSTTWYL